MEVLYDNGGVNRYRPEPKEVPLPEVWRADVLDEIEAALKALDPLQFETFTCGEETAREVMMAARPLEQRVGIIAADVLLGEFFESDWGSN